MSPMPNAQLSCTVSHYHTGPLRRLLKNILRITTASSDSNILRSLYGIQHSSLVSDSMVFSNFGSHTSSRSNRSRRSDHDGDHTMGRMLGVVLIGLIVAALRARGSHDEDRRDRNRDRRHRRRERQASWDDDTVIGSTYTGRSGSRSVYGRGRSESRYYDDY